MEEHPNDRLPPAVWTPEDASNFLRTAITESQRPLADLIRRQGVPSWILLTVIFIFVGICAGASIYLKDARSFFLQQLEKSESEAVAASADKDRALMAESTTRSALAASGAETRMLKEQVQRLEGEIQKQGQLNHDLRQQIATLNNSQATLSKHAESGKAEQEKAARKYRMQDARIHGLEAEKEALQKQLKTIRSLITGEESASSIAEDAPPPQAIEKAAAEKQEIDAAARQEGGQKPIVDYVPMREDIEGADTGNLKTANQAYWEASQLLNSRRMADDKAQAQSINSRAAKQYSLAIDAYEKAYTRERYNAALLSRLKMAKFQLRSLIELQK